MDGSPTPDDVTTPSSFFVFGTRKISPTIFLLIFVGTLIMVAAALALLQLQNLFPSSLTEILNKLERLYLPIFSG
jgi:hypothetical protein